MKQVGNLAIVCAQRKDTLMTLSDGKVKVVAGDIAAPVTRCARWDDDETISQIIHALNFGDMSEKRSIR